MVIENRKALREYRIIEKYEAGIKLTGPEVKSVKGGRLNFLGSYVKLIGNEIFLVNTDIPLYKYARVDDYDATRSRKLLLTKREINRLQGKIKEKPGLTIIPLKCYTKSGIIKLQIALSKGRKKYELKSYEKERQLKKEDKKVAKEFLKK